MSLTPWARLGPYEITAQIGVGGMGRVYDASRARLTVWLLGSIRLLNPLLASAAVAQTTSATEVPQPPETIARAGDDVAVRAVRLETPLELDGVLDEAIYETVRPAAGFVQVEPAPGAPAIDQTEVWVAFDGDYVYVAARCWDSDMNIVATEMRRDHTLIFNADDIFGFFLDTLRPSQFGRLRP